MDFDTYKLEANNTPIAVAGPNQTINCTCPDGLTVTLDGSGSYDPDNDSLTYTWTGAFGSLTGVIVQPNLSPGEHPITLTVEDDKNGSASDTVFITIHEDEEEDSDNGGGGGCFINTIVRHL
jgi:hypothetical protein